MHQQAAGVGCRWQSKGTCNGDESVWTSHFNWGPCRKRATQWHSKAHLMEVPGYPKRASFSALVFKDVWKISSGVDSHIADLCDQEGRIWLQFPPVIANRNPCHSRFEEASLGSLLIHLWVCFKMFHAYRLNLAISFQSYLKKLKQRKLVVFFFKRREGTGRGTNCIIAKAEVLFSHHVPSMNLKHCILIKCTKYLCWFCIKVLSALIFC